MILSCISNSIRFLALLNVMANQSEKQINDKKMKQLTLNPVKIHFKRSNIPNLKWLEWYIIKIIWCQIYEGVSKLEKRGSLLSDRLPN